MKPPHNIPHRAECDHLRGRCLVRLATSRAGSSRSAPAILAVSARSRSGIKVRIRCNPRTAIMRTTAKPIGAAACCQPLATQSSWGNHGHAQDCVARGVYRGVAVGGPGCAGGASACRRACRAPDGTCRRAVAVLVEWHLRRQQPPGFVSPWRLLQRGPGVWAGPGRSRAVMTTWFTSIRAPGVSTSGSASSWSCGTCTL
jgi:hypothetical protein